MNGTPSQARHRTLRGRAVDALRQADRRAKKYDRTKRLRDVIGEHKPWWDWGHRVMALVGRDDSGNWGPPRVRDLYFREVWEYPSDEIEQLRAGRPVKPTVHRFEVTRHAMTAWDGVKRGEEWRTFDSQDDGHTIRVGWLGDDGRLHDSGINSRREIGLFRRWLLWDGWIKAEWFGLRRWLYYRGLHAAVEQRIPFTCQVTPPPDSGGYSHWHCRLKKRHDGPHRYVNYTWVEGHQVSYDEDVAVTR